MSADLTPADWQEMSVDDLFAALEAHRDKLVITDEWGFAYTLERIRPDSGGLLLKVRRESVHPDA